MRPTLLSVKPAVMSIQISSIRRPAMQPTMKRMTTWYQPRCIVSKYAESSACVGFGLENGVVWGAADTASPASPSIFSPDESQPQKYRTTRTKPLATRYASVKRAKSDATIKNIQPHSKSSCSIIRQAVTLGNLPALIYKFCKNNPPLRQVRIRDFSKKV